MNFKIYYICIFFAIFYGKFLGSEAVVTVYEDTKFEGASRRLLPFKACMDLNNYWIDRISSVNTDGGCIILCENKRCKGRCEKIYPGTRYHDDFTSLAFNDLVSSYRNCESPNENDIHP